MLELKNDSLEFPICENVREHKKIESLPFLDPWHNFLNCHETGPILANWPILPILANMGPVSWQFEKKCHGARNGLNRIFFRVLHNL